MLDRAILRSNTDCRANILIKSDNQDLKEAQFRHKQLIDEGELALLKETEDRRGIVSPTG